MLVIKYLFNFFTCNANIDPTLLFEIFFFTVRRSNQHLIDIKQTEIA